MKTVIESRGMSNDLGLSVFGKEAIEKIALMQWDELLVF